MVSNEKQKVFEYFIIIGKGRKYETDEIQRLRNRNIQNVTHGDKQYRDNNRSMVQKNINKNIEYIYGHST